MKKVVLLAAIAAGIALAAASEMRIAKSERAVLAPDLPPPSCLPACPL